MAVRGKRPRPQTRRAEARRSAGSPARREAPVPADALDQFAELQRILSTSPQHFQLQFLNGLADSGQAIEKESHVWAADVSAAAHVAAAFPWPERAIRLRILDQAGRVVFRRLKPRER